MPPLTQHSAVSKSFAGLPALRRVDNLLAEEHVGPDHRDDPVDDHYAAPLVVGPGPDRRLNAGEDGYVPPRVALHLRSGAGAEGVCAACVSKRNGRVCAGVCRGARVVRRASRGRGGCGVA
eukprot:479409-Prymnesium_polylepis.1